MLTEAEIKLIKKSWRQLRGVPSEIIGDVFYRKLFIDLPVLKKMFKGSGNEQAKKLVDTLNMIVARLDRPDEMKEDVRQLALRHVNYGVTEKHYEYVGTALIWTLQQALGKDWNSELENAWIKSYSIIANTMITAARE